MICFLPQVLVLLLARQLLWCNILNLTTPADAFASMSGNQQQQSVRSLAAGAVETKCPLHRTGAALIVANGQAKERLVQFEQDFPASINGRRYKIGQANANETYCDGTNEQKYCNKIHGAWGDSIPRNGKYCVWAMLEFQDPPDFNYGGRQENGMFNDNTTKFERIFSESVTSLLALPNITTKVAASASYSGSDGGDLSELGVIPWPIASIIWKNGTQHAKDWIDNVHRKSAQDPGYALNFTFRGHYKAVECDKLEGAFQKNGISLSSNFVNNLYLADGYFKQYWNTFVDMEDWSAQLARNDTGKSASKNASTCLADCVVAPCPDTLRTSTSASTTCSIQNRLLGGLVLFASAFLLFQ